MNAPADAGIADLKAEATQNTDAKKRDSAGVLKYRPMGCWVPDRVTQESARSACSA